MNEEEKILKFINEEYGNYDNYVRDLLDLYNKEKEKNNSISIQYEKVVDKLEDLEQIEQEHKEENGRLREEIDKKDKIINLIGEMLVKDHEWFYSEFDNYTKQDFIKYFTNKVEEDK